MISPAEIILEYVCPILVVIISNLMWMSPLQDLQTAVSNGTGLENLNPTPWAFMLGNTLGWTAYGILAKDWYIFWADYPGFLISCWLNLGAVKLMYSSHHQNETRRSLVVFLAENDRVQHEEKKRNSQLLKQQQQKDDNNACDDGVNVIVCYKEEEDVDNGETSNEEKENSQRQLQQKAEDDDNAYDDDSIVFYKEEKDGDNGETSDFFSFDRQHPQKAEDHNNCYDDDSILFYNYKEEKDYDNEETSDFFSYEWQQQQKAEVDDNNGYDDDIVNFYKEEKNGDHEETSNEEEKISQRQQQQKAEDDDNACCNDISISFYKEEKDGDNEETSDDIEGYNCDKDISTKKSVVFAPRSSLEIDCGSSKQQEDIATRSKRLRKHKLPRRHRSEKQKLRQWGEIVWDVTSQKTRATAPHESLVMAIILLWTLVLSFVGFYNHYASPKHGGDGEVCGSGDKAAQKIVGYVVNINTIFFYGAPLSRISTVLKTKKSDTLHFPTMVTNSLSAGLWVAYALAPQINDPFIYVPSGLGLAFGILQFVLWIVFPKTNTDKKVSRSTMLSSSFLVKMISSHFFVNMASSIFMMNHSCESKLSGTEETDQRCTNNCEKDSYSDDLETAKKAIRGTS